MKKKMKTCKTILIFILMFTGYLCSDYDDEAFTVKATASTKGLSPLLQGYTEASTHLSEEESTPNNNSPPARHLSSIVVAGISISLVFFFIIIIAVFWYARKKSKERLAEMNSVLSTEPGVSLKNITMNENHPEWPFERALH